MNYSKAMTAIVTAIQRADTSKPGPLRIYLRSGKFTVEARRSDETKFTVIAQLSRCDPARGLRAKDWNKIETRIRKLSEKGKI